MKVVETFPLPRVPSALSTFSRSSVTVTVSPGGRLGKGQAGAIDLARSWSPAFPGFSFYAAGSRAVSSQFLRLTCPSSIST